MHAEARAQIQRPTGTTTVDVLRRGWPCYRRTALSLDRTPGIRGAIITATVSRQQSAGGRQPVFMPEKSSSASATGLSEVGSFANVRRESGAHNLHIYRQPAPTASRLQFDASIEKCRSLSVTAESQASFQAGPQGWIRFPAAALISACVRVATPSLRRAFSR